MSKELKAFERYIKNNYWNIACEKYPFNGHDDIKDTELDTYLRDKANKLASDMKSNDKKIVENALNRLAKIETPPTKQEVCEALSEYFKEVWEYYEDSKTFAGFNSHKLIWLGRYKEGDIPSSLQALPPHLITMIGRFYEACEEALKEIKKVSDKK